MPYLRFTLDLAVKEPIPDTLKNKLPAIRDAIRQLKSYASNIGSNEMTITAKYHRCNHDIGAPCGEEKEI